MHFVHSPHDGAAPIENLGGDWLEVRRGRTRFPHRPLALDRILIGAGTNCHLQLGSDLPMLHTLLTREQGRWRVEAIAPEPALLVNGTTCRCQTLCANDVIRIAEFEFVYRCEDGKQHDRKRHVRAQTDGGSASGRRSAQLRSVCREEASSPSADQLVNRLEQELDLIDQLGHDRRSAANGLLRAILRQGSLVEASSPRAA